MDKVLVLNADYRPLCVTGVYKGFLLVYLEKADLVLVLEDKPIQTVSGQYDRPSIIRLHDYVNVHKRRVSLHRNNIFKRDHKACVYCGSNEHLTIDHLVPKSKGGKDTWTNLVTACQKCNSKKGNKTLKEAGMRLKKQPFQPNYWSFFKAILPKGENEAWDMYL